MIWSKMIGLALLAASATAPAHAQPAAPQAASLDAGLRLAGMFLGDEQILPAMRLAWEAQLSDRPELAAIRAKDPGFVAFLSERIEPELRALVARELPDIRREVGALFHKHMTAEDIRAVISAYESPTGKRIQALNVEAFGYPAADRDRRYEAGMREIIAQASAADTRLFTEAGPSIAKLDIVDPEMTAAIRARMTRAAAEAAPRLREIADQAGRAYLTSHGPSQ
jgi:hypothetical protein